MVLVVFCLCTMALTFLVAMIWRPFVAALTLAGVVALGFAAPYVYFGVKSVMIGEPILGTWALLSATHPALITIAAYTVQWSLVGLLAGALVRVIFKYLRRKVA